MNTSKFALAAAAVAALGLGTASEGLAQACIGTPTISGQRALSGGVGFPEGATRYHARLDMNTASPLSLTGSYTRTEMDNVSASTNTAGAGVAYRLPAAVIGGDLAVQGCPTVRATYTFAGGDLDYNRLEVPVGVGLGTRMNVGAGMALAPYVVPQVVFSRTSTTAANQDVTTTGTGYGAIVGSALDFGPFFAGVDYTTTRWNENSLNRTDSELGLRIGVKF
jgi:hypothetical protein